MRRRSPPATSRVSRETRQLVSNAEATKAVNTRIAAERSVLLTAMLNFSFFVIPWVAKKKGGMIFNGPKVTKKIAKAKPMLMSGVIKVSTLGQ